MKISLSELLPNLTTGISNSGFFFGAGTSVEAGYPMMPALTRQVVSALTVAERSHLDEVLAANSTAYDATAGQPNIELVADYVISHAIDTGAVRFSALEERIRSLVTESILSVSSPSLDNHVKFLNALKARAFGRPTCIYIFTTNYDILFELAGAECGVPIETGFVGSVERFFDSQRFFTACGTAHSNNRFIEHPVLTIRLIKLHGSISWVSRGGRLFERHPSAFSGADNRVLILPRRRKVMDTLQSPYDTLFSVASRVIGADCKYMVSAGFSYGDDHINQNILLPAVSRGKIRLFALSHSETSGMNSFMTLPAFNAGFNDGGVVGGIKTTETTELWKFSQLAEVFK